MVDLQVLILDAFTKDLLAPLLKVSELRRHGVTMHLQLHQDRQPIADAPAIYFVCATSDNIQRIIADGAQVGINANSMMHTCWLNQA